MLIETHAHLDFPEYDNDRRDVIKRAASAGVGIIINVSSSIESNFKSVSLSREYDSIYAACGVHPHDAKSVADGTIQEIRNLISSSVKVVAIGEVGLDFYRSLSPRKIQQEVFARFIRLSTELGLPLIVHCRNESYDNRDASRLVLELMREHYGRQLRGVMHCFSGDEQLLREYIDAGLYVSFTCNVTFDNAHRLRQVLKAVPPERLLLETDSPFLSPQAKRGERNEPSYLTYLADAIAVNNGVTREEIERITAENARELFRIPRT
jgi:TatD DNase family protein